MTFFFFKTKNGPPISTENIKSETVKTVGNKKLSSEFKERKFRHTNSKQKSQNKKAKSVRKNETLTEKNHSSKKRPKNMTKVEKGMDLKENEVRLFY
jgi:hypothetical protein